MAGKKNETGWKNQIDPTKLDADGHYTLSGDEINLIKEAWNVKKIFNLKDIVQFVWNDPQLDGRSKQSAALKKYLAEFYASPIPANQYVKKTETEVLSDEDKEFIRNHAAEFKPRQISKLRWGEDCAIGDLRYRLCQEYYDSLPPEYLNSRYVMATKEYSPPKTPIQVLARLKVYHVDGWEGEKEESTLNNRDRECIRKLIQYTHTFRFTSEMNAIIKLEERKFCEGQFLRWTIDKPDLQPEDIDLFINLVLSMLDTRRMREELAMLSKFRDDQLEQTDADGKPQINMALGEQISELRKEISGKESKQETTINRLTVDRKQRLKDGGAVNFNMANLVEAMKEKDKRDKIIKLMEERKKRLSDEIERFSTMDSLKLEIFGVNRAELLS